MSSIKRLPLPEDPNLRREREPRESLFIGMALAIVVLAIVVLLLGVRCLDYSRALNHVSSQDDIDRAFARPECRDVMYVRDGLIQPESCR